MGIPMPKKILMKEDERRKRMSKFQVTMEEVTRRSMEVSARSKEEAREYAEEKLNAFDFEMEDFPLEVMYRREIILVKEEKKHEDV
jgi:hypothetical protein